MTVAPGTDETLARLRLEIERVDTELIGHIARRVAFAHAVGACKRAVGLAALDAGREAAVLRRAAMLARDAGLPEERIRELFWGIVGLCRDAQQDG